MDASLVPWLQTAKGGGSEIKQNIWCIHPECANYIETIGRRADECVYSLECSRTHAYLAQCAYRGAFMHECDRKSFPR